MIRVLDRYVAREVVWPLFAGTVVIAMLFVANDAIAIFKSFNVDAVPKTAIAQLLVYKFPYWLSLTLPVGVAMGASLAIARLARESEVTAMKVAGIRTGRILAPVVAIGLVMAGLNYWVVDGLIPSASKAYRKLVAEVGLLATAPRFQSNVTLQIDRFSANFGSVQRLPDGTISLSDVLLFERPKPGERVFYLAESGTYKDGRWRFPEPETWWFGGGKANYARRGELAIDEPIRIADLFAPPQPEEETVASLARAVRDGKEAKVSTTQIEVALNQKFAVPASCVFFALTGALVALRTAKWGPFVGLVVSFVLVVLYFNMFVISGEILGRNAWVSPFWAAWLPNGLYAVLCGLLWRRAE